MAAGVVVPFRSFRPGVGSARLAAFVVDFISDSLVDVDDSCCAGVDARTRPRDGRRLLVRLAAVIMVQAWPRGRFRTSAGGLGPLGGKTLRTARPAPPFVAVGADFGRCPARAPASTLR